MTFEIEIDLDAQLEPDLWRGLVRLRAAGACEKCGQESDERNRLHAHHLNGDHDDNRLSNGEGLCKACHHRQHVSQMHTPEAAAKISERMRGRSSRRWQSMTEDQKRVQLERMNAGRRRKRRQTA